MTSYDALMISLLRSSGPEDLPFFCLNTAFLISCSVIAASNSLLDWPCKFCSFA